MTGRQVTAALLSVAFVVSIGLWWWQERGDTRLAPARGRADATPVPGTELAGREGPPRLDTSPLGVPPPPTWRLKGRVTGAGGASVAGAMIEVLLRRGGRDEALGTAPSDRDGNYAVDLGLARALGGLALSGAALRALAWAPGHAPSEHSFPDAWPATIGEALLLTHTFELTAGDVLRGRVVDVDHNPVGGARVGCCDGRVLLDQTGTLPDGRYFVERPEGSGWSVVARERELGMGRVAVGTNAGDLLLPDLVLEATPSVEGKVAYADGSPVGGIEVTGEVTGPPDPCFLLGMGGATHTRADGTFRLLLPADGECIVTTESAIDDHVPCRTGDRDVRLIVRAHRLLLRVVDADGRPLPGIGRLVIAWNPENTAAFDALLAGQTTLEDARQEADYVSGGGFPGQDGTENLFGLPGSAWLFNAQAPGSVVAERALRVPAEGNETEVRLVIRPHVGEGRLRVRPLDPDGKPVLLSLVTVRTPLGSELFHGPATPTDLLGPFPDGPVRVSAFPIRDAKDTVWTPNFDLWLLEAAAEATIRDKITTDVVPRPAYGGRVRLTLHWPSADAEPAFRYWVRVPPERGALPVLLVNEVPPPATTSFSSRWDVNRGKLSSTLLTPGTHTLEATVELTGWDQVVGQAEVTVLSQQVTDVTIDLAPR